MYLDHTLISVFFSAFPAGRYANAPSLRDAIRVCVRQKNVVHLPENRCKRITCKLNSLRRLG